MKWRLIWILFIVDMLVVLSPSEATAVESNYNGCAVVKNGKCPDQNYIKFRLFTRSNPNTSQIITLEPDNLSKTSFKAGNPTKIFVHGFKDNFTLHPYYTYFKNQHLLQDDNHVIIVDFALLVQGMQCETESMQNAYHIAECVAGLIQQLRSVGNTDIHLIGSSLGAQIAGLVAIHLKPYLLPRITGLDPVGPFYLMLPKDHRLDTGDAIFVDVLHSNGDEHGFAAPLGHVDYYFNDGTHQPGCEMENVFDSNLCSHIRPVWYYAESLTSAEGFWGWQCYNHAQYYAGLCESKPPNILMGNTTNRGVVSIPTASKFPYALGK